ncbi:MAG: TonB-dependent receptor [Lysobacter sp.]|nr:TonB-dependent receptor [Lysobacter sp.]
MLQLKRNLLSVALASATLMLANGAHAQTAADQATQDQDAGKASAKTKKPEDSAKNLDKIVVHGLRRGIEDAIQTKQTSTQIVESVSAEDIGKLPDSSIAESIARLPGLTAQRERGRATQINIRGLSGDFAGTTLNGREQTTTSENRGVEFDQFPSELLSGVTVYKTPDASLVGQGLSGTVDMHTVRPLSFDKRVLTGNFRADQNRVNGSKEYGNRYSASYIDQFLDHTFGVAIGYAHLDSPQPGYQNEAWGYADEPNNTKVFGGGKLYKFDDNMKRDGLMTTLQYKPNAFWESTLDAFFSKFDKTEKKSGIEFGTAWGQGVLQPGYTVNGQGTITDSTWTNVKPVVRMDSNPFHDRLHSIGWNNKFTLSDHWSLNTDLSVSDTKRKMRFLETYGGLKANGGTTTTRVALDPSGAFNNITFGSNFGDPNNLQLIDAGNWGQDGYLKDFEIHDKLKAYRVDATRSFDGGLFSDVTFGFNRTDRTKDKSSVEAKLCLVACAGVGDSAPFPGTASAFNFGGLDSLATYDAEALLNSGVYHLQPKFHPDIANKNWSVHEKVDTFYAQLDIDSAIGAMPLRGNVGTQFIRVDQSSLGYDTFAGNAAGSLEKQGTQYDGFLPSLNLSLEFMPETYLRFAAARQMQRPRMDDMRASFNVDPSTNCNNSGLAWCGSGGNPKLHPWLANAFDVSLEKYFTTDLGNKGYFAAAFFYKDLKSYIYNQAVPFDFAGLPLPPPQSGQIPGVSYPTSTIGFMSQPRNGQGGLIAGTEFTASMPLDLVWNPLNGFGVQASYTQNRTSIHPNGPGTSDPLPGFSKYVSSITAYYEHDGFSIRLSQRKRSAFRGETRGFGADLTYINYQPEKVEDAQVNYTFATGAFAGLSLYLQVSNIGDSPVRSADAGDAAARPVQYFEYGRTTLVGFSYKF